MVKIRFEIHDDMPPLQPTLTGWCKVLGIPRNSTVAEIRAAHKRLIRQHHSDAGGDDKRAAEINAARDEALKELQMASPWRQHGQGTELKPD
jgi:hypothetical protein